MDRFDRIIAAVAQVETGNNPAAVGRFGERTAVQIRPETWRRFSGVPIRAANAAEVRRVARLILGEIERVHRANGLPTDNFSLALGWNAGAHATHFTPGTWDYARRVAALCD